MQLKSYTLAWEGNTITQVYMHATFIRQSKGRQRNKKRLDDLPVKTKDHHRLHIGNFVSK